MKTGNLILNIILTLLCIGTLIFAFYWKPVENKSEKRITQQKDTPPPIVYIDKDTITHIRQEIIKVEKMKEAVSQDYEAYVKDTLAVALGVAVDKINELTKIKAKLEGELKATKIELAENKAKKIFYENKYLSIVTSEDSTGNVEPLRYAYNAEINIANFSKRKNFWEKERYFIDISSPDKNFKINGLEHYEKQIFIRPKTVGLGLQFGYGVTQDMQLSPYIGLGVSWNLIRF